MLVEVSIWAFLLTAYITEHSTHYLCINPLLCFPLLSPFLLYPVLNQVIIVSIVLESKFWSESDQEDIVQSMTKT